MDIFPNFVCAVGTVHELTEIISGTQISYYRPSVIMPSSQYGDLMLGHGAFGHISGCLQFSTYIL